MDSNTFNEFVDSIDVNVQKLRDIFYNRTYKGFCTKLFCACCKPCNRRVRKMLIQQHMKK